MTRRTLLQLSACALAAGTGLPGIAVGAGESTPFARDIIPAPNDPADWPIFREQLAAWRAAMRDRLRYDDVLYRRPEFAWVRSCFACGFVMMCDQTFIDAAAARYRIDTYLDEAVREFGGYDGIVLWHAYPRIGLDDRNQFDFYRDMPGGLDGVREMSRTCHLRNVRVFVDYNPWDRGTRREGISDIDALVSLVKSIEADGIFLDTMNRGAAEFRGKLDAARPGVVLEGEGALPLENVRDHHMSWAQGFIDSRVPGVLRNKFFERRHMQHQIHRWNRDHSAELHTAWMNGSGMLIWENVFGTWVGWNQRDKSILRSMLPIQRRYVELFSGEGWTPLVPTLADGVFASLWEGRGLRLWTFVNRNDRKVEGQLLKVPSIGDEKCFDLISGELAIAKAEGTELVISGSIAARAIGAFVAGAGTSLGDDFAQFLASQRRLCARFSEDVRFPALTAKLRTIAPTRRYTKDTVPPDMAIVPSAKLNMKTEFRIRECGFYESQDLRVPGPGGQPLHGTKVFERPVELRTYAIGLAPVTNAQFAEFLKASGYKPAHIHNFLTHWKDGRVPAGLEAHPVVYVDLADARAYANWAGKRLPTEEEWQYAAQGSDGRKFPWGNEMKKDACNTGSNGTTPVRAFPAGRSPFGCFDMCGNVWEWTESERADGRTRSCIIRGGSFYQAKGSDWYMLGGTRPCDFAAKFLLAWSGIDRCATIGFRCAADVQA